MRANRRLKLIGRIELGQRGLLLRTLDGTLWRLRLADEHHPDETQCYRVSGLQTAVDCFDADHLELAHPIQKVAQ